MSELDPISFWVGMLLICWCLIAIPLGWLPPLLALVLIAITGWCCWVIYRRNVP